MQTFIPVCDGSDRYVIEVDPEEVDGPDVLHLVEPAEHSGPNPRRTHRDFRASSRRHATKKARIAQEEPDAARAR